MSEPLNPVAVDGRGIKIQQGFKVVMSLSFRVDCFLATRFFQVLRTPY